MKRFVRQIAVTASLCLLPCFVDANVGSFSGSGQTIWLSKTANVQMVSEQVHLHVVPRPISEPFDQSLQKLDLIVYDCKFTLKNVTDENVIIQVGFPLNGDGVKEGVYKDTRENILKDYKFHVGDDKKEYQSRFIQEDRDKKFRYLFVWDMTFAPHEVVNLKVTYEMPVSIGLADTRRSSLSTSTARRAYKKKWYENFQGALDEYFSYVTETGQSWAGIIEDAEFSYNADHIEDRLKNLRDEEKGEFGGGVFEFIQPDGWKRENGVVRWKYKKYKPTRNIGIAYLIYSSPKTVTQCERLMKECFGENRNEDDLKDFREIVAATYGVTPSRASVKEFVEDQVWFDREKPKREHNLTDSQKKVLAYIDSVIRNIGK